jgi:hypothetical protein
VAYSWRRRRTYPDIASACRRHLACMRGSAPAGELNQRNLDEPGCRGSLDIRQLGSGEPGFPRSPQVSRKPVPRGSVQTFCTVSRRPAGPHAPPTRHARLRSRYGGANAGRLARKAGDFRAAVGPQQFTRVQPRGVHAPAAELSKAGQNPSRPSVTAGQPHPSNCPSERITRRRP